MKHSQSYLSYQRRLHELQRQDKATGPERDRYRPAVARKAMGKPQVK